MVVIDFLCTCFFQCSFLSRNNAMKSNTRNGENRLIDFKKTKAKANMTSGTAAVWISGMFCVGRCLRTSRFHGILNTNDLT